MAVALPREMRGTALAAGLLYLVIILCGIGAEVGLRGPLVDLTDAEGTAAAIRAAGGQFRLAIAADLTMALADAGLALLLYALFRAVAPGLALAAMVFRLIQTVLIAGNLLALQAAWLLIRPAQDSAGLVGAEALALVLLHLHAHGYDLGLVFFGVNSLLTGALLWRAGFAPRALGGALGLAGLVYLAGSGVRFFAPELLPAVTPAYLVPVLAETAFCLWLLGAGRIWAR